MTAKEKAEEMVKKYIKGDFNEFEYTWISDNGAKKLALIAADEILESLAGDEITFENEDEIDFTSFFKYWREVKQEIENL